MADAPLIQGTKASLSPVCQFIATSLRFHSLSDCSKLWICRPDRNTELRIYLNCNGNQRHVHPTLLRGLLGELQAQWPSLQSAIRQLKIQLGPITTEHPAD